MKHKHHIIPKHMGGTDHPDNLVEVSVEEHANLHLSLYLEYGKVQDWVAYHMISGHTNDGEWARLTASNTPENIESKRDKMKARWQDPDQRQMRLGVQTPEYKERVRQGVYKAQTKMREEGRHIGRKSKPVLYEGVLYHNIKELAHKCNIHLQTAYRYIYTGKAVYQ